jgi:co-chaperonin GroES (HSP10)
MAKSKFRPLHDRVVVKRIDAGGKGIILTRQPWAEIPLGRAGRAKPAS